MPATNGTGYLLDGHWRPVTSALDGDLRIAYVSCNGQEHRRPRAPGARAQPAAGTRRRRARGACVPPAAPRRRPALRRRNARRGSTATGLERRRARRRASARGPARDWSAPARLPARALLELYAQPETAWLMARVPSLCMWDDHDICDGWGSLPPGRLDAPLGRLVFAVAREFFLLFQLGARPDAAAPPLCRDPSGKTLTWDLALPGLTLIAPDLRSERRPDRVMGPAGDAAFRAALAEQPAARTLVLSSVPALGPRLSGVERAMHLTRRMEKYEDDLRDQWQSRAHRDEWRAFLGEILARHERGDSPVTLLSGEIHLATRATMAAQGAPVHQLVASGITHPPPPRAVRPRARRAGPARRIAVPAHPIRLRPCPASAQRLHGAAQLPGDRARRGPLARLVGPGARRPDAAALPRPVTPIAAASPRRSPDVPRPRHAGRLARGRVEAAGGQRAMEILLWSVVAVIATAIIWKGSGLLESSSARLSAYYELPDIVQGAVVVAVGSSFPELSTTVISTLVHGEFELGVAAIVGSALFNILVIPALSGLSSREQLRSNRDLVYKEAQFYMIAVAVLTLTFSFAAIYNPVPDPGERHPGEIDAVARR
ncbi:MAG: hypothetical protein U5K43_06620 [Halofilum sp. (in: g-proteobacteria)]|nr:hypothetical protein [Halofilum sp. (in: g-proteobacteria)]